MQVVEEKYTAMGAIFEAEMRVDFESNSISLQEVDLENGWRIFPVFHPEVLCTLILLDTTCDEVDCLFSQITKEEVDIYKPGRHIPSCKLKAEWTKQSKPSRLIHKVTLKGAKQPLNYINIDLDCDPIPLGTLIIWEPNPNS